MNEPVTRFGSARTIGRGMRVAPALSHGLGLTFGFAFLGTGARLVIPILIQQSIDHGLQPNQVRVSFIALNVGYNIANKQVHLIVVVVVLVVVLVVVVVPTLVTTLPTNKEP